MAIITAILALIGTLIPFASILTFLIVAVPIILLIVRHNLATGVLASFVAAFLVGILTGPILALLFYVQFMGMALVYGVMFKNKAGAGRILVVGTIVAVISTVLLIGLTLITAQISLEEQRQGMYETVDRSIEFYERTGMIRTFEEQGMTREDIKVLLTETLDLFFRVLPAMLVIASMITAFANFIMARLVLTRVGFNPPQFPPFSEWRLPWYGIWGLIAGWGSYLAGDYYGLSFWRILGQNVMIAYGMILFVLGLAVFTYFFKKYQLSFFSRMLISLLFIMIFNIAILVTVSIGMFDMILDYRKLNKREKGEIAGKE